jgi:hypothetical protein
MPSQHEDMCLNLIDWASVLKETIVKNGGRFDASL